MRNKNLASLLVLFTAILFFSCKKDIDTVVITPNDDIVYPIPPASPVTGRISGIVVDENNAAVQNADVVFSGTTYQTDANGLFHINNAQLDKYVTTVTVNKAGYFKALRSFSATASRNYLSIKLIPKTMIGTVDAAAGGNVSISNGTTITFPQSSVVIKSTGAAYSGTVNVYAAYIDPTSSDFAATVPGSMMAKDNDNMYVLQSTGMIAVELESTSGQSLQLATGKTAAVKLPIPSSLISKAPATIDTWSLNDQGLWVKEGTATKNGDFYDMQVSHFSFWNCDVPANAIYLTIHLVDQNNQPLSNTVVQLTIPNNNTWWATTYGFTDSTGTVSGLVPASLGLEMNVSANVFSCFTPIYTQNVGPFTSDTTLNVTITLNTTQTITINGTLNDCNGQPVQTGTASLLIGNYSIYNAPVINGNYSISVPFCSGSTTSATVWLADSTTGAYAAPVTVAISGNSVTVPTQVACGTQQGAGYNVNDCLVFGAYTVGIPLNTSNYMNFIVYVLAPGTYSISSNPVNGVSFSGSGYLDHIGLDTITLPGTGTPVNPGTFTVTTQTGGTSCGNVFTTSSNVPPAVIQLGAGTCPNLTIAGNYVVNYPTQPTDFVTLTVNVISAGSYYISTDSINGYGFSGSGVFTQTGTQTVALAASGTPLTPATTIFTTQANGVTGCTFIITSTNTGSSNYNFVGAPGNCANSTISGAYQSGVTLLGPQNGVSIQLEVLTVGAWSIMTNPVNGITFAGSGVFSSTGLFTVFLTATGTPIAPGVNTFEPNGGSSQGCVFTVTTL